MSSVFKKEQRVFSLFISTIILVVVMYVLLYFLLGFQKLAIVEIGYGVLLGATLLMVNQSKYLTAIVSAVIFSAINSFVCTYYLGAQGAYPVTYFAIILAVFLFTPLRRIDLILIQLLVVIPTAIGSFYWLFHYDPIFQLPQLWTDIISISTLMVVIISIGGTIFFSRRTIEKSEKELRDTEGMLQAIINSTADVSILVDLDKRILNFNESAEKLAPGIFGKKLGVGVRIDGIIDGKRLMQFNENFEKAKYGNDLEYNVKIEVDGRSRWFDTKYSPVRGANGALLGVGIVMNDITEKKEYQEEVKKLALVSREIDNAVIITDADEKIEWVNAGFTKISGYSLDEVKGKKPTIFQGPETSDETKREIRIALNSGESIRTEILNYGKNGSEYWLDMTIQPLKDENGKIERFIAVETDITEKKKKADQLKRNEQLLEEMGDVAKIGGWVYDLEEAELEWTNEMYRIYGMPLDADVNLDITLEPFPKEVIDIVREGFERSISEGEIFQDTLPFIAKDGVFKYVRYIGKPVVKNGEVVRVYGALQDVTRQVESEQAAREKELLLESINKNIQDGIYRSTPDKGMVYANEAFAEIFGYDNVEEVVQHDIEDFYYHKKDREKFLEKLKKARTLRNYEIRLKHRDGSSFWGLVSGSIYTDESGQQYIDGSVRDISQLKKTQSELVKAKEKAEKASMAKAEFLSTMSHEIRTPMNAVIGMTELLLMEEPRDDQLENLETLKFSAENLLNLINDILDYSKIEAGKIDFEEIEFNPYRLVNSIVKGFQPRAEDKNVKIKSKVDDELPNVLLGDPTRLSQVLSNLVSNAVKFTNEGSITVGIDVLKKEEKKVEIRFSVKDTGIGIPRDKQEDIFKSFQQADSSITRNYGGTGLGLAIIKKLLEIQESKISIESEVGKGSEFYFKLSFKYQADSEKSRDNTDKRKDTEVRDLSGMKILIVEDNLINQRLTEKFLTKWNIESNKADNGKEAVELASENTYDLILMDLQMPEMNGYEATMKIREFDKEIPIIAMTASAMLEIQDKVYDVGMNDFITKPVSPKDLNYKLSKYRNKNA